MASVLVFLPLYPLDVKTDGFGGPSLCLGTASEKRIDCLFMIFPFGLMVAAIDGLMLNDGVMNTIRVCCIGDGDG